jgi:hypothetical protein
VEPSVDVVDEVLVAVAVGGTGVLVAVAGTGVAVSVGGTGVFVAVGGTSVFVGVAVGGTGVLVAVAGTGVAVFVGGTGAVTVRVTVALWVTEPSVPVTVMGYVPGAAVPAFTLRGEELPAVTEVGLTLAVAPEGVPLTASETVPDPLTTAVLMVDVPLVFGPRLRLVGLALIEKSFAGGGLPHPGYLKDAMRVCQLNVPLAARYSCVYQNVQSSTGSTVMEL